MKEVAFKTIDLKAEHGRLMAMTGQSPEVQPGGNLTTWLRSVRPSAYLFIAARIVSKADLDAVIAFAQTAAQVEDHVGVYCFGPSAPDKPTARYRNLPVPTSFAIERVLYRACQDLAGLRAEAPVPLPTMVSPALVAEDDGERAIQGGAADA